MDVQDNQQNPETNSDQLSQQQLPDVVKLGHNKLQLQNEKLMDEINVHKIKINDLSSQIEYLSKERQSLIETVEKQKNNINNLSSENDKLNASNNEYKSKLTNERNTHENIKNHLTSEIDKMKETNVQHITTQNELKSHINELMNKINEWVQKYNQLSSSNTAQSNELEFKKKEIAHLQMELNTICNHNKTLHEERNSIKHNLDNYVKQVNELKEQNTLLQQQKIEQQQIEQQQVLQQKSTRSVPVAKVLRGIKPVRRT